MTQIERMAEAATKEETEIKKFVDARRECGQTTGPLVQNVMRIQAAIKTMPEPIENYRPEMGAVLRKHNLHGWVLVACPDCDEYWQSKGSALAWHNVQFTPYFIQIPKQWAEATE